MVLLVICNYASLIAHFKQSREEWEKNHIRDCKFVEEWKKKWREKKHTSLSFVVDFLGAMASL